MANVPSDIDIARVAKTQPIGEIGTKLDIPPDSLLTYGPTKAKISNEFIESLKDRSDGVTDVDPQATAQMRENITRIRSTGAVANAVNQTITLKYPTWLLADTQSMILIYTSAHMRTGYISCLQKWSIGLMKRNDAKWNTFMTR